MWRVHRLDRIIANIPAKLLDSKSLTLNFSRKQIWPVYLCDTPGALALYFPIEATARLESFVASGALPLVAGTEFTGLIYRGVKTLVIRAWSRLAGFRVFRPIPNPEFDLTRVAHPQLGNACGAE